MFISKMELASLQNRLKRAEEEIRDLRAGAHIFLRDTVHNDSAYQGLDCSRGNYVSVKAALCQLISHSNLEIFIPPKKDSPSVGLKKKEAKP